MLQGAAHNLNSRSHGALIQIKRAQPDSGTRAFGRWEQLSVPKKQDAINGIRLPVWIASGGQTCTLSLRRVGDLGRRSGGTAQRVKARPRRSHYERAHEEENAPA
jgi:hypothetical protein